MSKPIVIYHGQCRDGFCAAWCVWRRTPGAEFFAASYGAPPPDVAGREVIMVDFCYSLDVMNKIGAEAKSLLLLDHHKSAEEAMCEFNGNGCPSLAVQFDMNRSGAGMAWDHFHPGQPRPWIVDYVEDRDLWRHALPNGPAVNAFLGTLRYEFEAWYKASRLDIAEVAKLGEVVEDKIRHYVIEVAKNSRRITFEGFEVPIVNAPQVDISELVGFLSAGETFAMGWWQRADGSFSYSLRSRGDFDVSELAKRHGGGGHKNAAGFQSATLIG
jgi:oligoribonuclease NrnB/cAMP/cGMP phosphodiesterase (DHH superfamily)